MRTGYLKLNIVINFENMLVFRFLVMKRAIP